MSAVIYACTPPLVCVFPGVFLSSRMTGACPVTTDLIMRVNVRTKCFHSLAAPSFGLITYLSFLFSSLPFPATTLFMFTA